LYSTSKEEEILETSPTNVQMQEALRILRRAVQHRTTNCQRHYECEQFIQELLNANKQQGKLHTFLNSFLFFIHVGGSNDKWI
jgi:translation initiation factor 2B subunit (eIF-2B alpha/beta/delta family)